MAVPKVMQPTPSWLKSYAVIFTSLLAGASTVHNILKPDLTIPTWESEDVTSAQNNSESSEKSETQKLPST